jgi:1-aminocyclopropane-1-carboxylate deaminase/D-cysteine desulfhydrase-like pyridoxal-dependent ACC family enzyme
LRELPRVALGSFPTPVVRADVLAEAAGVRGLWVKCDDLSAEPYGGNKVRKLEFLLGEALRQGATDVITFGAAGSNHALATAVYGAARGLKVHSMLAPQHNASYVGRNLRASVAVGAELEPVKDMDDALREGQLLRQRLRAETGREPFMIPFGGTSPASTAGFVNAALEFADQIEAGELPEPDFLYVTLGSMGTAAGLVLGLRAAGLRTRVVAVPVISDDAGAGERLVQLLREAEAALRATDPAFPVHHWSNGDFDILPGFVGDGYAVPTGAGLDAIALADAAQGLHLDTTYTGKTLAALLSQGSAGDLADRDVVFWNTLNSRDITPLVDAGRPECLPVGLRGYLAYEGSPTC